MRMSEWNDEARVSLGDCVNAVDRFVTFASSTSPFAIRHIVATCPTIISKKSELPISPLKRPGAICRNCLRDAADATTNVMIDNIEAIQPRETRQIELSNDKLDMLLFDLLQELIFLKDAERLLLRMPQTCKSKRRDENYFLQGNS